MDLSNYVCSNNNGNSTLYKLVATLNAQIVSDSERNCKKKYENMKNFNISGH